MENDDMLAELQRGRGKNKVFWIEEEVNALIDALRTLALDRTWKTDCGFRSNYMQEVRKIIIQKIPTFNKEVQPHIESKIKWIRGKYNAINEMLRESGCSWNEEEQKIKCEKQWHDAWVKRHKDARGTWDLKFPYLDALELAFGRDRATGQAAEGFDDAVQILEADSHPFSEVGEEYEEENVNGRPSNGESSSQSQKRPAPPAKTEPRKMEPKKKKRSGGTSLEETLENVNSNLVKCFDGIAVNFTSMATTMLNEDKREQETFAQKSSIIAHKSSIIAELQRLGISDSDIFKAGVILRGDESKLDVFYQFSDEMKKKYVHSLLYPNGF